MNPRLHVLPAELDRIGNQILKELGQLTLVPITSGILSPGNLLRRSLFIDFADCRAPSSTSSSFGTPEHAVWY
jgi:hypothetical protein